MQGPRVRISPGVSARKGWGLVRANLGDFQEFQEIPAGDPLVHSSHDAHNKSSAEPSATKLLVRKEKAPDPLRFAITAPGEDDANQWETYDDTMLEEWARLSGERHMIRNRLVRGFCRGAPCTPRAPTAHPPPGARLRHPASAPPPRGPFTGGTHAAAWCK